MVCLLIKFWWKVEIRIVSQHLVCAKTLVKNGLQIEERNIVINFLRLSIRPPYTF